MAAALLEASVDERATLEAAFALIDGDDWRADLLLPLGWPLEAPADAEDGDSSDALSVSDSSAWISESPRPVARHQLVDTAFGIQEVALPPASTQARAPSPRARAGNTKKEELARLRADVKGLQARADLLQRRRIAARMNKTEIGLVAVATQPTAFRIALGAAHSAEPPLVPDSRLSGLWMDIAERQRRHRTASEVENMRLRALVKGQTRVINSLKTILQRQIALQKRQPAVAANYADKIIRGRFSPADVVKLREMWEELDLYYLGTDYAFQLNGLAAAGYAPVMTSQITPLSATTTMVEVIGNGLFPLGYREVFDLLWKCIESNRCFDEFEQQKVGLKECGIPDDGNSIVRAYTTTHRFGGAAVVLQGSCASRKFLEQDRSITVYSGVARAVQIQGKTVEGITTSDHGRIVISDVPSASGSMCFCQATNTVVVEIDSARTEEKVHVNALADVFIASKTDIYDRLRDIFECALLGQAPTRGIV